MDQSEIPDVQAYFERIIEEAGLAWVVRQAQEQADAGNVVERVPEGRDRPYDQLTAVPISATKSTSKRATLSTVPYSPSERLLAIVHALRRSLTDSYSLTRALHALLGESGDGESGTIKVYSVSDDSTERTLLNDSLDNYASLERLSSLLDRIESEISR